MTDRLADLAESARMSGWAIGSIPLSSLRLDGEIARLERSADPKGRRGRQRADPIVFQGVTADPVVALERDVTVRMDVLTRNRDAVAMYLVELQQHARSSDQGAGP